MNKITVQEAADLFGLRKDTIRRKLRSGSLKGEKVIRNNVRIWLVHVDDALQPKQPALQETPQEMFLQSQIDDLREDRDRWREIAQTLVKIALSSAGPVSGPGS
jgi:excisionase family DNA binding protein